MTQENTVSCTASVCVFMCVFVCVCISVCVVIRLIPACALKRVICGKYAHCISLANVNVTVPSNGTYKCMCHNGFVKIADTPESQCQGSKQDFILPIISSS